MTYNADFRRVYYCLIMEPFSCRGLDMCFICGMIVLGGMTE